MYLLSDICHLRYTMLENINWDSIINKRVLIIEKMLSPVNWMTEDPNKELRICAFSMQYDAWIRNLNFISLAGRQEKMTQMLKTEKLKRPTYEESHEDCTADVLFVATQGNLSWQVLTVMLRLTLNLYPDQVLRLQGVPPCPHPSKTLKEQNDEVTV